MCSGQSNMEMRIEAIGNYFDNQQEISEAGNYNIRFFTVDQMTAITPQSDLNGTGWLICDSSTVKNFSAVGYFFGKYLFEKLNVPVGLINSSYGGTDIEAWTSINALSKIPAYDEAIKDLKLISEGDTLFLKEYHKKQDEWLMNSGNTDPGFPATGLAWNDINFDAGNWDTISVPALWYKDELIDFNGAVWHRKEVFIPESWKGKDLVLNMGPIDDIDVTWFNGVKLGSKERWNLPRKYLIPASIVRPGKNLIAIRCIDNGGPGGLWGDAEQYYISDPDGNKISIAGEWKYKRTISLYDFPPRPLSFDNPNYPTVLFNAMISPLIPYGIKGVIWYQGENNTGRALRYRTLFPLMINNWRTKWNEGEFPFLFVQLANYMNTNPEPVEDAWAELREAQLMTLKVPNTGMASSIDIGDSSDIHPKNKREVGRRLSLIALNKVYGFDNEYSGPVYKSYKIDGSKIIITFDFANGLNSNSEDKLKGFAIAGSDHKFYWADAVIDGGTVIVSCPLVSQPVAVRYAWASNPVCNLYNSAGLPASPFRTDNWEVLTKDFEK